MTKLSDKQGSIHQITAAVDDLFLSYLSFRLGIVHQILVLNVVPTSHHKDKGFLEWILAPRNLE